MSGPEIKKKGIESVRRIRSIAPDMHVIGMGGIKSGRDIVEYIKAGADAVALGSAFDMMNTKQVIGFMEWLVEDLKEEMEKEGVTKLKGLREKNVQEVS